MSKCELDDDDYEFPEYFVVQSHTEAKRYYRVLGSDGPVDCIDEDGFAHERTMYDFVLDLMHNDGQEVLEESTPWDEPRPEDALDDEYYTLIIKETEFPLVLCGGCLKIWDEDSIVDGSIRRVDRVDKSGMSCLDCGKDD